METQKQDGQQEESNLSLLISNLTPGSLAHQLVQTYSASTPAEAKEVLTKLLKSELDRQLLARKSTGEHAPD
jgi:hypothetical protein